MGNRRCGNSTPRSARLCLGRPLPAVHVPAWETGRDLHPVGPQLVGAKLQSAGSNGLQQTEIKSFINGLPARERGPAASFFAGPYRDFSHLLLAQGSAEAFAAGVMCAVVAILVAVFVIKRDELPAHLPAQVPVAV